MTQRVASDGTTASYYELPEGCKELQDLISYRNMNAQDGEMFRAIYRKGIASHSDELRDAKKVLFYAKAEVERLERYVHQAQESCSRPEDFYTTPDWSKAPKEATHFRPEDNDRFAMWMYVSPAEACYYVARIVPDSQGLIWDRLPGKPTKAYLEEFIPKP